MTGTCSLCGQYWEVGLAACLAHREAQAIAAVLCVDHANRHPDVHCVYSGMRTQEGFILPAVPLQFVLPRVCLSLEEALSQFTGLFVT